jgi:signal transduction histidine kinase
MDLELIRRGMSGSGDQLGEPLSRTREVARTVHALSHRLHPARLRLVGLVAAIEGLRQELSRPGVRITLTHDHVPRTLPPDVTLCAFRVVQEAVQNAVKHGEAGEVAVHLRASGESLEITVTDDGCGFDVQKAWGGGLGLLSMSERVEAFGGHFAVASARGTGTRVHATVPWLDVAQSREVMS